MFLRILLSSVALAVCALWPQGIILCAGEQGHVEFEIGGGDCCPTETGDRGDCVDTGSPDLRGSPARAELSAPRPIAERGPERSTADGLTERVELARPLSLSPDEIRCVILLI